MFNSVILFMAKLHHSKICVLTVFEVVNCRVQTIYFSMSEFDLDSILNNALDALEVGDKPKETEKASDTVSPNASADINTSTSNDGNSDIDSILSKLAKQLSQGMKPSEVNQEPDDAEILEQMENPFNFFNPSDPDSKKEYDNVCTTSIHFHK